jgi:tetratricopeptide (TPR) repeat protein
MDAALITVLDALPKVADILADGYCNWPPESDLDFQASALSDISIFDDSSTADFHRGIIIPGPLYTELNVRTMQAYDACSRAFHEAIAKNDSEALDVLLPALHNIIALGTGAIVSHAANTFFYSVYNNQSAFPVLAGETLEEWLAYSENLLRYIALQDIDSQNANALSNLATLLSDRGDYKSALRCIEDALEILANRDDTKTVSLAWQPGYIANLSIELELYISKASIFMEQDKHDKARELAEKVIQIAKEHNHDSGEVLAAKYILENI